MDEVQAQWERIWRTLSNLHWEDFAVALGIFLIFLLFRKVFTKYIYKLILAVSRKTPAETVTNLLMSFEKPLRWFWVIIGTYLALLYLPFHITTVNFVQQIYSSFIIALFGWGFFNYFSQHSTMFTKLAKKTNLEEDSMLIPFLSKFIRAAIVVLTFVIILSENGVEIGAFVAGLGVAGLAISLAAQDTISNFLGGVVIVTEKPFSKGDWIETPTIEGTVEDISFRSTQIRTFSDTIVTIPNSTIANDPITNWSTMRKRRVDFELGIMFDTPTERVEKAVQDIEKMLRSHEGVHQDVIMVNFTEFRESRLGIFIYYFTKTTIWSEYLNVKEDVNKKILNILKEDKVDVAIPSQNLIVAEPEKEEVQKVVKELENDKRLKEGDS
ncbi:mechanosensitive ion channel protein [Alkalihalobacillus alcalophilus ATCC 27647 = CGMCC 1.3604]|uniref:Mechanosensitive ion channel protein n=1 Tax=Alkalihalobacillus alcalophilus ATCC 27647 = CGMCC 1.3604 TaxID=1218173 RepID=A0A094XJF5_ALKAL|nr:mechanosensitive ion channel family protein [Alkalihalobacillus alcalophilus]KGA98890.1 mechanosensitive ion channel protein [Alkalihalobacillus alcalophilus ATCC 27647 = CGMCC 1.3604]MED1560528.1 mechanosensitive ion channel family protein [Alkalihalobacillus alcalophilus]THG88876.1 mechanosensitive ion channel protein [Alkalihalobacillus alcalophilus ATCC 27647 = CGMCC 1.3604]